MGIFCEKNITPGRPRICKWPKTHEPRKTTLITFHYTYWLVFIGILINGIYQIHFMCIIFTIVGGCFPTHLKNMSSSSVRIIFPKVRGEHEKCLSCHPPRNGEMPQGAFSQSLSPEVRCLVFFHISPGSRFGEERLKYL